MTSPFSYENRRVVVTGGARGVGAALLDVLSELGAGPLPVHPDAPFGGWKASGFGPPEHGEWDAWFATRLQAVYGDEG